MASLKDILKIIEIWRVSHAVETWKLMQSIFTDLADETLLEVPVKDTDIDEDDSHWVPTLNESKWGKPSSS